ncbi:hypothetical protein ACLGI4_06240 [Streptomyces sp. HMX112]|uniref:hypothetical protein n=1 Tax=Streptomyces sp. HMX112 TaxID=3390850 RepID=UPI003A804517
MLHEIEGVEQERSRVSGRPEIDPRVPLLAFVELDVEGTPEEYAGRLRGVLAAVYDLAAREDFDEEELPVDTVPAWFAGVCRGGGAAEPSAARGRERYTERTGDGPWELQDWLSRFDPELEARGWAFWDLTRSPGGAGRLRLWVDTWGEPFFSWEELRWLAYTCGARSVADPVLAKPEVWAGEASV